MQNIVGNKIILNQNSVWVLDDKKHFNYSEGQISEKYLEEVFLKAKDLRSDSEELEQYIKDWPSEYHLSHKRSQLLRGFKFDKRKKVLEVGCGCGAITRYLGETFDNVVAVEGSEARAHLARLHTKDLKGVSILCAPFHEIKFKQRFDIIFCIGVLEYSSMFVNAKDPYDYVLKYFHDILAPDGIVVIAIENQFGLKYFSSSREDHTKFMFDGIEGYPRYGNQQRTFGYGELRERLSKYYEKIEFYFPYPDYKMPSAIFSEEAFKKVKLGEMIGNFPSRDYMGEIKPLFDEKLALWELDKNNMLPFFANSFLVFAGKQATMPVNFDHLGLMYSPNRLKEFRTVTQVVERKDGRIGVKKVNRFECKNDNNVKLRFNPVEKDWMNFPSLHSQLLKRTKEKNITIPELFFSCSAWLKNLQGVSIVDAGEAMIDGRFVDSIWANSYVKDGECYFIDDEWVWKEKVPLNVLVIKSIYYFLYDIRNMKDISSCLKVSSTRKLIVAIAKSMGIELRARDFRMFCLHESEMIHIVFGVSAKSTAMRIDLMLFNKVLFVWLEKTSKQYKDIVQRIASRLGRAFKIFKFQ